MAGVFVVIVPTEEFEVKCREKEEATLNAKNRSNDRLAGKTGTDGGILNHNGGGQQQHLQSNGRPQLLTQKSEAGSVASSTRSLNDASQSARVLTSPNTDKLLQKLLEESLLQLRVHDAVWHQTKENKYHQVVFTCESQERCEEILQTLYRNGIGRLYESTLCVVPCSLYYEAQGSSDSDKGKDNDSDEESDPGEDDELHPKTDLKSLRKQFIQSIKARLTVAQVVEGVKAGAKLTFDFIMFVVLASLISALGLVENSPVIVVASMLISPIMGPIMAWTFGTVIKDRMLQRIGIKSELIGLAVCIMTGFVFGLICGPLDSYWGSGPIPTTEMVSRGKLRVLWVGMLIALPSGAGVALSILGGNAGSLVGVAISASLLPPCVNAGMLWAYSLVIYLRSFTETPETRHCGGIDLTNSRSLLPSPGYEVEYSCNMVYESLLLGVMSLLLCFVNIICIVFMAIVVLKIKEVAPYTSIPTTARFWKEDIKITRDYNKTIQGSEAKRFGHTFLEEWAALNNIDPSNTNAQTASQLNYLRNVVEEAGDDEVYRTVIRYIGSHSPVDPVTATLGSLNRTTWPHPGYQRGSVKKPKVWDIDFNPRGASTRRRMFSDPSEKYTPLHTISETDVDNSDGSPNPSNRSIKVRSGGSNGTGNGAGAVSPAGASGGAGDGPPAAASSSSSSAFHTPSRLLRSLIGSKRFVVTRADVEGGHKQNRKSKKVPPPPNDDVGV